MLKLGLLFGGMDLSIAEMARVGREAELNGLDGLYTVEAYRNGLVPLAALAQSTERVTIGSYVLNAYCRTPFAAGLAALDLNEMASGRLEIAVGSGNAYITQNWLGLDLAPALEKMRDYVSIMRLMLRTRRNEKAAYRGQVHSLDWVQQAPGPADRPIPIYLAAIFPKMLKVAAHVADGVALGALTGPKYIRDVVRPAFLSAAKEAGRNPEKLGLKVCTMIAVHNDRQLARYQARRAVAGVFAAHPHPYYEHMLREQGFSRELEACLASLSLGNFDAAVDAVGDDVIDALIVWGTPQECADKLLAYDGLVDETIFANVGSSGEAGRSDCLAAYRTLFNVANYVRLKENP